MGKWAWSGLGMALERWEIRNYCLVSVSSIFPNSTVHLASPAGFQKPRCLHMRNAHDSFCHHFTDEEVEPQQNNVHGAHITQRHSHWQANKPFGRKQCPMCCKETHSQDWYWGFWSTVPWCPCSSWANKGSAASATCHFPNWDMSMSQKEKTLFYSLSQASAAQPY